jgi:hypothetical protein
MGLRKWLIVALIVLIALGIMTPALAWKASKIGVSVGDFFFGNEATLQKPSATLFHSQTEAATDAEALAINFPATGADLISEPSITALGPSIAQTSAETATAADTGFFKANWCYTAFNNLGGYSLVDDISAWHPIKSSAPVGSGVSWPYMNNAPLYGENTMTFQPVINKAVNMSDMGPTVAVTPVNTSISKGTNATNATAAVKNATKKSTPNRDYKNMTKADIQNTTGLERLYRNANMANTVPQSYKGTVDRPTMIAPMENPMDLIKPTNKTKSLTDAGKMTQAGSHLTTKGWDL